MTLRDRIQQQARFGEACFRSILSFHVPKLPPILKNVTHCDVPSRSVLLAVTAGIAPPRSNGATEYAGCPIELSKLGHTFS